MFIGFYLSSFYFKYFLFISLLFTFVHHSSSHFISLFSHHLYSLLLIYIHVSSIFFTVNLSSFSFFNVLSASSIVIFFHPLISFSVLPWHSYSSFPFLILFVSHYHYLYRVHTSLLIILFVYRSHFLSLCGPPSQKLPHSTSFIFLLLLLHTHDPLFALPIYVFVPSFTFYNSATNKCTLS